MSFRILRDNCARRRPPSCHARARRAAEGQRRLGAAQPGSGRQPLLDAGSDQRAQREDADAALAVPVRASSTASATRPPRSSSTGRCTSPTRAAASTRVNAADGHLLWSFDVTKLIGGGRARGLRLPQPRRRRMPTASSTRPPARSCSRSTPRPASRSRPSAPTARRT